MGASSLTKVKKTTLLWHSGESKRLALPQRLDPGGIFRAKIPRGNTQVDPPLRPFQNSIPPQVAGKGYAAVLIRDWVCGPLGGRQRHRTPSPALVAANPDNNYVKKQR